MTRYGNSPASLWERKEIEKKQDKMRQDFDFCTTKQITTVGKKWNREVDKTMQMNPKTKGFFFFFFMEYKTHLRTTFNLAMTFDLESVHWRRNSGKGQVRPCRGYPYERKL